MSPYAYLPMLTHLVCLHTLTYQFYTLLRGQIRWDQAPLAPPPHAPPPRASPLAATTSSPEPATSLRHLGMRLSDRRREAFVVGVAAAGRPGGAAARAVPAGDARRAVSQVVEMGFSPQIARAAIRRAGGSVVRAVEILLSGAALEGDGADGSGGGGGSIAAALMGEHAYEAGVARSAGELGGSALAASDVSTALLATNVGGMGRAMTPSRRARRDGQGFGAAARFTSTPSPLLADSLR